MHAEAASCISLGVSLSECMQLPTVALHSWVHFFCHPIPDLNQLPACSSSALTSAHWCLSSRWHLPGLCLSGRLDIGLPHLALHSLVTHVWKICHNLIFWELRPKCWEDTLPNIPGGIALTGCGFAHLCQWQPDQQVSPSQSLSGVGFPALAQLGPHLRRWAPQCVYLTFIPVNLTPETVRCQIPQYAEIQWAHGPRNSSIYK